FSKLNETQTRAADSKEIKRLSSMGNRTNVTSSEWRKQGETEVLLLHSTQHLRDRVKLQK
ncbi:hypothetical protein L9F63_025150, partial [Diploptera punctata]